MTVENQRITKIQELRVYLEERFPGFAVRAASPDDHLRYRFYIDSPNDPTRSRRLTISLAAIDDLNPAEVIALLEIPRAENLWQRLGIEPLHLQYDVLTGLDLPSTNYYNATKKPHDL